MNRLLSTLCALLLLALGCTLALAQARDLRMDEKEAIVALLKDFSQQHHLLRPLNLKGDPLAKGVRMLPTQYMGQVGPGQNAFASFHFRKGAWQIQNLILEPNREDLLHGSGATPLLSTDDQAWDLAERQFSKEISQGYGLERGKALWQSFEGREKVAVRLTFKPKQQDYPVGESCTGLSALYRASDGALVQVFIQPPLAYTTVTVKAKKEDAVKMGARALGMKPERCSVRLAFLMPFNFMPAGIIDRRTGQEAVPTLKLMWEVAGPTGTAAVDAETGVVAWFSGMQSFPKEIVAKEPTTDPSDLLAQGAPGLPWTYQDLLIQGLGFLAILLAVGFVIYWLMKQDRASQA
jgi:hypothetical protein